MAIIERVDVVVFYPDGTKDCGYSPTPFSFGGQADNGIRTFIRPTDNAEVTINVKNVTKIEQQIIIKEK